MKYILRKYNGIESKLTCPSCGRHHCFTPYIDVDTQEIIDETVGMCDHKNSCGYHLPPREFFQNNRFSYNFLRPQSYSKNLTPLKNIFTPSKFTETPLKNIKTPLNFYKTPSFADSYRNCREFSDKFSYFNKKLIKVSLFGNLFVTLQSVNIKTGWNIKRDLMLNSYRKQENFCYL